MTTRITIHGAGTASFNGTYEVDMSKGMQNGAPTFRKVGGDETLHLRHKKGEARWLLAINYAGEDRKSVV